MAPDTPMPIPSIDPSEFRQLMGRFATGVVVITSRTADGRHAGMTANSLASVSLDPPLLSLCIDHGAEMHRTLLAAREFVVNILASHQEAISRRFAVKHEDRFDGIGYHLNRQGLAVLDGVLAHVECEHYADFEAGDHTIVVGRVIGGATTDGRPLLYYRGGYAGLAQA